MMTRRIGSMKAKENELQRENILEVDVVAAATLILYSLLMPFRFEFHPGGVGINLTSRVTTRSHWNRP